MKSHTEARCLFNFKNSAHQVWVKKKDNAPLAPMPPKEFNALFSTSFAHGIFYDPKNQTLVEALIDHPISKSADSAPSDVEAVKTALNNPKNYLNVRYVNKTCGFAAIAACDIPAGTCIGPYSSELIFRSTQASEALSREQRAYDMSVYNNINLNGETYQVSLRALTISDETRFAIHLPSEAARNDLPLDRSIPRDKILTCNVSYPKVVVDNRPGCFYITTRDIKKNEWVGIDYGDGYWKHRGMPCILIEEEKNYRIAYYNNEEKKYKSSKELIAKMKVEKNLDSKEVKKTNTEMRSSSSLSSSSHVMPSANLEKTNSKRKIEQATPAATKQPEKKMKTTFINVAPKPLPTNEVQQPASTNRVSSRSASVHPLDVHGFFKSNNNSKPTPMRIDERGSGRRAGW